MVKFVLGGLNSSTHTKQLYKANHTITIQTQTIVQKILSCGCWIRITGVFGQDIVRNIIMYIIIRHKYKLISTWKLILKLDQSSSQLIKKLINISLKIKICTTNEL